MNLNKKINIGIIGGGIGGVAAAVALHRAGIEATVYERATEFREVGAGMMLWPNATRVLKEFGLLERVAAASGSSQHFLVRSSAGTILMDIGLGQFEVPALCTRRSDLLAGLTVGDVARRDVLALPPEAPVVAAWALLRLAVPQDLLLLDHGRVVGIVTRDRLAAAVRHRRDDDSVALHADPHFVELQAEWPLADVSAGSLRSSQTLFPVYASGQLTGVLDALHLEETVRLIRRRPRRD